MAEPSPNDNPVGSLNDGEKGLSALLWQNRDLVPLYAHTVCKGTKMSLAMHHVVIDCHSPSTLVKFWAAALDYELEDWGDTNGAVAFNPEDRQLRLLFLPVPEPKTVKNRLHIGMETEDNDMNSEVERLVGLGASKIEQRKMVMETWTSVWTVMADPEGNEFCVSKKPTYDQPQ